MRRSCLCFIVLIIAMLMRPENAFAQTACAWSGQDLNLTGQLGGTEIHLWLTSGYPAPTDDGISGVALSPRDWMRGRGDEGVVALEGRVGNNCEIELREAPDSDAASAGPVWRLRPLSRERFEGTRTAPQEKTAAVSLSVARPADCSGKGAWRTFVSAKWPVTFQYPASWRVSVGEDYVVIECPSAALQAWGGYGLSLRLDENSEFETDDGRRLASVGEFVEFRELLRLGPAP